MTEWQDPELNNCLGFFSQEESSENIIIKQQEPEILEFPVFPILKFQQKIINQIVSQPKKKKPQKKPSEYKKNICGYITKKIIRQLLSSDYREIVENQCILSGVDYETFALYYAERIERITGPSHLPALLDPKNNKQKPIKQAFKTLFEWFLRERYIRYLLDEGKMTQKQVYIKYKNEALYHIIHSHSKKFPNEKVIKQDQEQNKQNIETKLPQK